ICFHFQLDGVSYPDDLGKSVPFETFYRKMIEGAETSTSQINIAEYLDYFEGFLKEGKDVLHITFSSGLSGSYLSARSAADIARERYPERKLFVVDSLAASSGYGLLMDKAADLRDEGLGIEELAKWVEENRLRLHHWFFSTDLTFYIKGGRVSKTSGAIAGVLGICPLLNMDEEGRLTPRMKIRSKKKVKEKIVEQMQLLADDRTDYSGKCYICHSACLDDAKDVAEAVESAFPKLNGKVEINNIGTVIGSHTGPGTVALFFWGDSR
ncbi:MAG: DegV family protein, partial [Oscillospiraceae bacterium]|nr:DegV family protein [Oscillospiraceae bacterium]